MDPLHRHFMFESWIEDRRERQEEAKTLALLIGAFIDPEKAKRMANAEANTFVSDDEEFDKFSHEMLENNRREDLEKAHKSRRGRRRIAG